MMDSNQTNGLREEPVLSARIPFEALSNTRDLGGMIGEGGRTVRPGRLFRSGHLYFATEADRKKLSELTSLIIDLRTPWETAEKPDPEIPGAVHLDLPAFESLAAGVSRDARSNEEAFMMVARDSGRAREHMIREYRDLVTKPAALACYGRFFRELLRPREKAVLWHCTAGKDRAGLAAVFVQEALGVPRETVFDDYMKSGEYLAGEVAELKRMAASVLPGGADAAGEALDYLFCPYEEFLETAYETIEGRYGSTDAFLEKGLGLTEADRDRLREMYLI